MRGMRGDPISRVFCETWVSPEPCKGCISVAIPPRPAGKESVTKLGLSLKWWNEMCPVAARRYSLAQHVSAGKAKEGRTESASADGKVSQQNPKARPSGRRRSR